jgi:hypothetical protein
MLPTKFPLDTPAAPALSAQRNRSGTPAFTLPVQHPGRAEMPRVLGVTTGKRTHEFRIVLPGSTCVGAALRRLLDGWRAGAGCGRIVAGACAQVQYHVMMHAAHGARPYVYSPPIVCNGNNTLIGAAITLGRRQDGTRILHCHGGFVDAQGRHHGGHVILDETFTAAAGLQIRLCLFDGIDLVASPDAETTFDLLQPV